MGSERDQLVVAKHSECHEEGDLMYPPEKYRNYLACPFPKHDPGLHETVNNVCTGRWGFKDITALIYHFKRVHTLKHGCIHCKKRFTTSTKTTIEDAKRNHDCKPQPFTNEHAQWMTKEQKLRLAGWKESEAQDGGAKSWAKIYSCLFPGEYVPKPYYDYLVPRHLMASTIYTHRTLTPRHDTSAPDATRMGIDASKIQNLQTENPYVQSYGNDFDWSVTPAIDSAYGSGSAAQEPEAPFSQDRAVAPGQYLPHRDDTEGVLQHVGGVSDQVETEYGDLNLDENE